MTHEASSVGCLCMEYRMVQAIGYIVPVIHSNRTIIIVPVHGHVLKQGDRRWRKKSLHNSPPERAGLIFYSYQHKGPLNLPRQEWCSIATVSCACSGPGTIWRCAYCAPGPGTPLVITCTDQYLYGGCCVGSRLKRFLEHDSLLRILVIWGEPSCIDQRGNSRRDDIPQYCTRNRQATAACLLRHAGPSCQLRHADGPALLLFLCSIASFQRQTSQTRSSSTRVA